MRPLNLEPLKVFHFAPLIATVLHQDWLHTLSRAKFHIHCKFRDPYHSDQAQTFMFLFPSSDTFPHPSLKEIDKELYE